MTKHTTKITALFPATIAATVLDNLTNLLPPVGERHFSTTPNRVIDGDDYVYLSTVATPELAEAWRQVAEEMPEVSLNPCVSPYARAQFPDLPEEGQPVEQGQIYRYGDGMVMARQSHTRTQHAPGEVLALFVAYRSPEQGLEWIVGEEVKLGTLREYEGGQYIVHQPHVTQDDWRPDTTPSLWREVEKPVPEDPVTTESNDVPEWEPGETVVVGDLRSYEGDVYECIQAHNTINSWEPPNVPALWQRQ